MSTWAVSTFEGENVKVQSHSRCTNLNISGYLLLPKNAAHFTLYEKLLLAATNFRGTWFQSCDVEICIAAASIKFAKRKYLILCGCVLGFFRKGLLCVCVWYGREEKEPFLSSYKYNFWYDLFPRYLSENVMKTFFTFLRFVRNYIRHSAACHFKIICNILFL